MPLRGKSPAKGGESCIVIKTTTVFVAVIRSLHNTGGSAAHFAFYYSTEQAIPSTARLWKTGEIRRKNDKTCRILDRKGLLW
ncbi:MAG: hypothetical protein DBY45_03570 [Clostridiales bacterium]|nr:MAG: hypothetical protein DBY45_03570 [Clostridiales bacterium]